MDGDCISMKRCNESDLAILRKIGIETYSDAYSSMNAVETMDRYLEESFSVEKIRGELLDENCRFYMLYVSNQPAGYIKVNTVPAQSDINDEESIELERIYVRSGYQGRGFGRFLIDYAVTLGRELNKKYIWLGVWKRNEAAIAFYGNMGFEKFGTHTFRMGDEVQYDFLMRRNLGVVAML